MSTYVVSHLLPVYSNNQITRYLFCPKLKVMMDIEEFVRVTGMTRTPEDGPRHCPVCASPLDVEVMFSEYKFAREGELNAYLESEARRSYSAAMRKAPHRHHGGGDQPAQDQVGSDSPTRSDGGQARDMGEQASGPPVSEV